MKSVVNTFGLYLFYEMRHIFVVVGKQKGPFASFSARMLRMTANMQTENTNNFFCLAVSSYYRWCPAGH